MEHIYGIVESLKDITPDAIEERIYQIFRKCKVLHVNIDELDGIADKIVEYGKIYANEAQIDTIINEAYEKVYNQHDDKTAIVAGIQAFADNCLRKRKKNIDSKQGIFECYRNYLFDLDLPFTNDIQEFNFHLKYMIDSKSVKRKGRMCWFHIGIKYKFKYLIEETPEKRKYYSNTANAYGRYNNVEH